MYSKTFDFILGKLVRTRAKKAREIAQNELMPETNPPVTYQLKIVLLGISPIIWQRIKAIERMIQICQPESYAATP